MLSKISWPDYLLVAALLFTVYYLFVGLRFYTQEVKGFFSGRRSPSSGPADFTYEAPSDSQSDYGDPDYVFDPFEPTENDEFEQVEELIGRLKTLIPESAATDPSIPEFVKKLKSVFIDYPIIRKSAIRSSINDLVVSECEKNSVSISLSEVDGCWLDG